MHGKLVIILGAVCILGANRRWCIANHLIWDVSTQNVIEFLLLLDLLLDLAVTVVAANLSEALSSRS
ncbi:hypothetical protein RHMOL_Rhmol10G0171200 [Rhododendron molle]|uniref:Uncharacterized protein n=1 Tax=Rhododendron molle TaxID=49168 RepID=A0ACC0M4S6_RHOML|nr:hypothetical protein RHMOL_Rhmol10G0171200 [Rhododendron molle]